MTRPKRRRLTTQEHRALGALTKHIREHLMSLQVDIQEIAGPKAANHLLSSARSLDKFTNLMDDWFCLDQPKDFDASVYYGPVVDESDDYQIAR